MLARSAESTTLTQREQEGLRLFSHGGTSQKIAGELCLGNTVCFHLRNIYSKISVDARAQAVHWAMQHSLGE